MTLTTAAGVARPVLRGAWFNDGFRGAMGALLVAIEDGTEPANGAAENLRSLSLAFAAIQSSRTGREVAEGAATEAVFGDADGRPPQGRPGGTPKARAGSPAPTARPAP